MLNIDDLDVLITHFEPQEVLRVTFAPWSRWEWFLRSLRSKSR